MDLQHWQPIVERIARESGDDDGAHDLSHLSRVWENARDIMQQEAGANALVVLAACYLHDLVNLPKNHPDRAMASRRSAEQAVKLLREHGFPAELLDDTAHAIEAHSFSAAIPPRTLEAKIVQDADRLDALGYVGIGRMIYTAGRMGIRLAHHTDPLGKNRPLDDQQFSIDHIVTKLATLPAAMQTETGRAIAVERVKILENFRSGFAAEWR